MKNQTQLREFAGGESIGVVFFVVANREEGSVELLQLHHILVPHSI